MPTDVPTFRARLLDERAAVVAELATIDLADEQARIAAAEQTLQTAQAAAQATFDRASRRWNLVQDKQARLLVLDVQIATVTP
jgi:hypothetical protein